MKLFPLLFSAIIANAFGNTLLSRGMKQLSIPLSDSYNKAKYTQLIPLVITNPSFLLGTSLLIIFFILFLSLLSKADLSYVLPVTAINYVLTVLFAAWMLGEVVSPLRWSAVVLIAVGVILVSKGKSITT